jgi:organic hydroperoxide reductase OsmC/OhrA
VADDGHFLSVRVNVRLPGVEPEEAQELLRDAERRCPYSKATHGNFDVAIKLA